MAGRVRIPKIQPGSGCRGEVHRDPRVLRQPCLDRRVLVGGVVVGHHVQLHARAGLGDLLEEPQELSVAVPVVAGVGDLPGGEALYVVRWTSASSGSFPLASFAGATRRVHASPKRVVAVMAASFAGLRKPRCRAPSRASRAPAKYSSAGSGPSITKAGRPQADSCFGVELAGPSFRLCGRFCFGASATSAPVSFSRTGFPVSFEKPPGVEHSRTSFSTYAGR